MGGWNNNTYFATANLKPTDKLDVTVGWTRVVKDVENTGRYYIGRNSGNTNCDLVGGIYQFYCGELPVLEPNGSAPPSQPNVDPRSQGLHATTDLYRVDARYAFTNALSLNYLFGHVSSSAYSFDQVANNSLTGDIPGADLIFFLGLPIGSVTSDSHELRLSYDNGHTRAALGGFYSTTNDNSIVSLLFVPGGGTDPLTPATPDQIVVADDNTHIDTKSVFGLVSQDFLDNHLNIDLEGRYTRESKSDLNLLDGTTLHAVFSYFTPRVEAKWNFSPNNNVYISAARGVKSGGFNGGDVLPGERTYAPESNWTYEIGTKNLFFDGRLQVNADVFYVDWTDLQTPDTSANPAFVGTITRNLGSVTDPGAEISIVANVARGLTINGGFAYADPRYGKGIADPRYLLVQTASGGPETVCNGITCPADGRIGGNQLPVQSRYQGTLGIEYAGTLPVGEGAKFRLGADVDFRSRQYVDPLLLTWVPHRTLVNLNGVLSYRNLELQVFVKNLLDLKYAAGSVYDIEPPTNIAYEVSLGERRTVGVTMRFHY